MAGGGNYGQDSAAEPRSSTRAVRRPRPKTGHFFRDPKQKSLDSRFRGNDERGAVRPCY